MKKFIPYQTGKICVHTQGRSSKRMLVLLHGFCEDHTVWLDLLPELTDMRVVCIDLPGFGKSTPLAGTPSLLAYTQAIAHVLDALGLQKTVLVGHSLGGYVALQFAGLYPDRLYGFGLINSHPLADSEERRAIRTRTVGLLENGGQRAFVKQLLSGLFEPQFAKSNPELVKGLIRKAAKYPTEGIIFATLAMRDRADQTAVLSQTQKPVLFILGEKDHLIPTEAVDQFIHLANRADVHLLPGVAHMAMFEQAPKVADALRNFTQFCLKNA
jgi:pimeloyl-ACP methyl ester carboxylesterase